MDAPLLMNAVHIAWMKLLHSEQINAMNIETAPLRLLAAVMYAAQAGEQDARLLADAALADWKNKPDVAAGPSLSIH
jgi:type II secretory pathway component PulK